MDTQHAMEMSESTDLDRWMDAILVQRSMTLWRAQSGSACDETDRYIFFALPNRLMPMHDPEAWRSWLPQMDADVEEQTSLSIFKHMRQMMPDDQHDVDQTMAFDTNQIRQYWRYHVDDALNMHVDMVIRYRDQLITMTYCSERMSPDHQYRGEITLFDQSNHRVSALTPVHPPRLFIEVNYAIVAQMKESSITHIRQRYPSFVDDILQTRSSLWAYMPMVEDDLELSIRSALTHGAQTMDVCLLASYERKMPPLMAMDKVTLMDAFIQACYEFQQRFGLNLMDDAHQTHQDFMLITNHLNIETNNLDRLAYVVQRNRVQVFFHDMRSAPNIHIEPMMIFDPRSSMTRPGQPIRWIQLSNRVVGLVVTHVIYNLVLNRGRALVAVEYHPSGQMIEHTVLWNILLPDTMVDESHLPLIMILYGAFYARYTQEKNKYRRWPLRLYRGHSYGYVWRNTMILTRYDGPETASTPIKFIEMFLGTTQEPNVTRRVFDLGPQPYRMWHPQFVESRLDDPPQSLKQQPMEVDDLNTIPWMSMHQLMHRRANNTIHNHEAMQGLQHLSGPKWVHVRCDVTIDDGANVIRSQAFCLPSWLGPWQMAMPVLQHVWQSWAEHHHGPKAQVTLVIIMGQFDPVVLYTDLSKSEVYRQTVQSMVKLIHQFPPIIVAWPDHNDHVDWPMRMRGLFDDLKLTLSLSTIVRYDMSVMIRDIGNLQYYASVRAVNLEKNRLGLPMIGPEAPDVVDSTRLRAMARHQGWLVKSARSLTRHALFLNLHDGWVNVLTKHDDDVTWVKVNVETMIAFVEQAMQDVISVQMHQYWLDRDDVYANLLEAARIVDGDVSA